MKSKKIVSSFREWSLVAEALAITPEFIAKITLKGWPNDYRLGSYTLGYNLTNFLRIR